VAEAPAALGAFDRDSAVTREEAPPSQGLFAAGVSPDWQAGRGPHGGYIAAMLLRALIETVDEPARGPRSLTIHYARAPAPGPVSIHTVIERAGRSLSTLSARMEQDGSLVALALAAFSVPWSGVEIAELEMPPVVPPDAKREAGSLIKHGAPAFTRHLIMQRRLGTPFTGDQQQPMEVGCWIGHATPRPVDALSLAFFLDALVPAPFMRLSEPVAAPTIDLTVHFRAPIGHEADVDPGELCFVRTQTAVIHDGFFEEDGVVWAPDGRLLAQSRQLAILLPMPIG
jgi:acyl-CoA thioesterase